MNSVSSAWVKALQERALSLAQPLRRGKAGAGQLDEACLGLGHRPAVCRVELMPRVACVIHHDLDCHGLLLGHWTRRRNKPRRKPAVPTAPALQSKNKDGRRRS
jgi:hypothetical protein